jgi:hypothetical protein
LKKSPESGALPIDAPPPTHVVYANVCNVRITPEEVGLYFGQRKFDDPNQGQGVVTVYTNLSHAKRLALVLLRSIKNYEELFGEIPENPLAEISPEMIEALLKRKDDEEKQES